MSDNRNLSEEELKAVSGGLEMSGDLVQRGEAQKASSTVMKNQTTTATNLIYKSDNKKKSDLMSGDVLSKGTFC